MGSELEAKAERPILGFACTESRCIPIYLLPLDLSAFEEALAQEEIEEPQD
jgi:hypothetical protein